MTCQMSRLARLARVLVCKPPRAFLQRERAVRILREDRALAAQLCDSR